jgi:hypothetical protein
MSCAQHQIEGVFVRFGHSFDGIFEYCVGSLKYKDQSQVRHLFLKKKKKLKGKLTDGPMIISQIKKARLNSSYHGMAQAIQSRNRFEWVQHAYSEDGK